LTALNTFNDVQKWGPFEEELRKKGLVSQTKKLKPPEEMKKKEKKKGNKWPSVSVHGPLVGYIRIGVGVPVAVLIVRKHGLLNTLLQLLVMVITHLLLIGIVVGVVEEARVPVINSE